MNHPLDSMEAEAVRRVEECADADPFLCHSWRVHRDLIRLVRGLSDGHDLARHASSKPGVDCATAVSRRATDARVAASAAVPTA